jgi:hypothetical protein
VWTRSHLSAAHLPLTASIVEETRCQLAGILMALIAVCCTLALFAPENPMLDRLLPFLAQQLALVVGYYFGQKGR